MCTKRFLSLSSFLISLSLLFYCVTFVHAQQQSDSLTGREGLIVVSIEPEAIDDEIAALIRPGAQKASDIGLDDLPNETVAITVKSADQSGTITYLVAGTAVEGNTYIVTQDYMKYKSLRYEGQIIRVGIGLRVRANVVVNKKNLDLSGLLPLGIAASEKKAKGSLTVEVIGIGSREVTSALPLPAQLSQESVINAIQSVASIKGHIYDGYESLLHNTNDSSSSTFGSLPHTHITVQIIAREFKSNEVRSVSKGVYQVL